jgi:hypothetical protein
VLAVFALRPFLLSASVALAALASTGTASGATGGFERAWGKDVVAGGGTGFEICTVATSCQAGAGGPLGGELYTAHDVAVDSAGNAYVAEVLSSRIQKFDPLGNFVLAWGKDVVAGNAVTGYEICTAAASCKYGVEGGLGGEFNSPNGVAVDSSGNVYVADTTNHRIQKFDSSGDFLLTWGKDVSAFGGSGFETCSAEVLCLAGDPGSLGGEFRRPADVAVGPDGDLQVADQDNRRIQKVSNVGAFRWAEGKDVVPGGFTGHEICAAAASCKTGEDGEGGGEFSVPAGLGTDATGSVYVADWGSDSRIQKFDSSGNFTLAWGKDVIGNNDVTGHEVCTAPASCQGGRDGVLGGELTGPRALTTDSSGDVYVAESSQRIQKFNGSGAFLRAWGKDVAAGGGTGFEICTVAADCQAGSVGGLGGELSSPLGLGAGPGSKLYVAESPRIQVFGEAPDPPPPPPPTGTDSQTSSTGTLGTQQAASPQCQVLRKKLKKAKTKRAKQKIRRKLRALRCH